MTFTIDNQNMLQNKSASRQQVYAQNRQASIETSIDKSSNIFWYTQWQQLTDHDSKAMENIV